MSTVEKLFVQIFERKKSIIEQVKHQTDLFDRHLASKCLLDGIAPPPWLWSPSLPSFVSHPNELKKEELISVLLLPRPRPANPYSNSVYSLNTVVTADNGALTDGTYTEVHALNKNVVSGNRLSVSPQFPINDVQCTLNEAHEQDFCVTSPQDCGDAIILDSFPDQSQSLARIQRSKSRQRALELRNSAKAVKTRPRDGHNFGACTSRIMVSGITSLQYNHVDESELVKAVDVNNKRCMEEEAVIGEFISKKNCSDSSCVRTMRSTSSSLQPSSANDLRNVGNTSFVAKDNHLKKSIIRLTEQPNHVNELSELVKPSSVIPNMSCAAEKPYLGDYRDNEMVVSYSGGISRPGSSSPQPSLAKEPLDEGNSYVPKEDSGFKESIDRSGQQPNYVNEILELVKPAFVVSNESYGVGKVKRKGSRSKEKGSNICSGRMTGSRSSSQQQNSVNICLKLDSSCGNNDEEPKQQLNHIDNLRELVKPIDVNDKSCGMKGIMSDFHEKEDRRKSYSSRIKRSRSYTEQLRNVEGFLKVNGLFNIAKDDGDIARFLGKSSQSPPPLSLVVEEGCDPQETLGFQANVLPLPFLEREAIVEQERCDAIVAETHTDSGGLVEACSVASGSNLHDANLQVEILVSGSPAECAMLVEPKQLDFDDMEECNLNQTSYRALGNVKQDLSPESQPSTSLHSTDMLHKAVSVDYQEKHNLSSETRLLDPSGKEKPGNDPSEAHMKDHDVLVDENIIDSVKNNANYAISQDQNADTYLMGSWPQHMRIKTGAQFENVPSASPRLMTKQFQPIYTVDVSRHVNAGEDDPDIIQNSESFYTSCVEDAAQSNIAKIPIEILGPEFSSPKLQVEEVQLTLEGRDRSENNTWVHKQLGPSVLSLTKPASGASQGSLLEKVGVANPDGRGDHITQDNQVVLQLENRCELGSMELSTCSQKIILEQKSYMGGPNNLSYCSVGSPQSQSRKLIGADQNMPKFEGFVIETDDEQPCIAGEGINFDKLDLPNSALERAIVVERLCKSASLHTPLSHFSTTCELPKTLNVYQSIPTGLLESMELRSTLNAMPDTGEQFVASSSCLNRDFNSSFHVRLRSDCLPFSSAQSAYDSRKPYLSPVGKLWGGITSKSGSSEKRTSSIPDLPSISEENENIDQVADTFQDAIGSEITTNSVKREPLADIMETLNPVTSSYEAEILGDRCSFSSVNTEISFPGTCKRAKPKVRNQNGHKRRYVSNGKENHSISLEVNGVKRANESVHNRFSKPKLSGKTVLRKGGPNISERESKHNNIVSHVTSFIPLVQQKQAAVITGKRDVKVKALEAAEAAKCLAEKKENERKMRKEAMKIERARMEEQNLRQLEQEKEKKEQERKRKETEMAAKKRQREEEIRKEKERKRKRVEEARRQQVEHEEKLRAEKEKKQSKYRAADEKAFEMKRHENMEKAKGNDNIVKVPETEPTIIKVSTIDATTKAGNASKDTDAFADATTKAGNASKDTDAFADNSKVLLDFSKEIESNNLLSNVNQEESYEISPYKGSDDEDEEDDDDIPDSKFVPSWASKSHLALVISSQQRIDPESIFSPESFCNIAEVLLPRKLQQK